MLLVMKILVYVAGIGGWLAGGTGVWFYVHGDPMRATFWLVVMVIAQSWSGPMSQELDKRHRPGMTLLS
jgi:hypothetical protein